MMVRCNNCGASNGDSSTFCATCGRPIERLSQVSPLGQPSGMGGYMVPAGPAPGPDYNPAYLPQNPGPMMNRPPVNKPLLISFIVVTVVLLGVCGLLLLNCFGNFKTIQSLQGDNASLASKRDTLQQKLDTLQKDYDNIYWAVQELKDENMDMKDELAFFNESIAFVIEEDNYYHTYHCPRFQNADGFWAYNVEAARGFDYSACPECH